MPELVMVSTVEKLENLKNYINEQFARERYAEITQAIGMYSILMDPEHMIGDQDSLYHLVLNLLKKKVAASTAQNYSKWLISFPATLAKIVADGTVVTDAAAQSALASRHGSYGPFTSLDEFYFWALDDRRLPLDQIVRYVQRTVELSAA